MVKKTCIGINNYVLKSSKKDFSFLGKRKLRGRLHMAVSTFPRVHEAQSSLAESQLPQPRVPPIFGCGHQFVLNCYFLDYSLFSF